MTLQVGICGWQRAQDEVLEAVNVMEVQRTFYQPPQVKTAERWRSRAPEGFTFTTKAWQTVTHPASSPTYDRASIEVGKEERDAYGYLRETPQVREGWERTEAVAEALEAPFVVLQCPPSFEEAEEAVEDLRAFAEAADPDARLAWEPRGGWDPGTVADLCGELGWVHVTDPLPRGTPVPRAPVPPAPRAPGRRAELRVHVHGGGPRGPAGGRRGGRRGVGPLQQPDHDPGRPAVPGAGPGAGPRGAVRPPAGADAGMGGGRRRPGEPGCVDKLHEAPDNPLHQDIPVERRMSEEEGPPEELVERVEPLLSQSEEITQDLFELIGRQPADLHEEIERTVETLQVFFNKWIVEIMYILRVRGVLRFNELKDSLGGISGRTLSTRLTDLEERGLVHRELYDEMPVRVEYSLTEKGHDVANLSMPLVLYLRADEQVRDGDGGDGGEADGDGGEADGDADGG